MAGILQKAFVLFLLTNLSLACNPLINSSQSKISRNESKDIELDPSFQFFRPEANKLSLYFSIDDQNLLFSRESENTPLKARIRVTCQGLAAKTNETIWEITQDFERKEMAGNHTWLDFCNLDEQYNFEGGVLVTLEDLNRRNTYTAYSLVDDRRSLAHQFLTTPRTSNFILVQPYFSTKDSLSAVLSKLLPDKIESNVFKIPENPAPPPFSDNPRYAEPKLIQSFEHPNKEGRINLPVLNYPGLIQLAHADTEKPGYTVRFFKPSYPALSDGADMVNPLIYISTTEEFKNLKNQVNPRKAAEEFWLERCNNKEKTRTTLGSYYERVSEANKFFSSYLEGWKTDRGMIYVVFGKPESISKRANEEIWIYGREINTVRLSFTFVKRTNPFSNNHYELVRNNGYRAVWSMATNAWRNGRIFTY